MANALLAAITHLLSPRVCHVCGASLTASESVMCLQCNIELPRTGIHKIDFNEMHQRLGHHAKVDRAAGWFTYRRQSQYASLLVDAKYGNLPYLARELGAMCAKELSADHFFDGIDALVPMPIHWLKKLRRGYNQSYEICKGISSATSIEIIDNLRAVKTHGTQSRHNRKQRFASIANTLDIVQPWLIAGKHVLIVDDIVTSGASMIEAVRAVHKAAPAAVSVLALGLTALDS